jgi:metal-sulfur cluster biosynthetic enzyme
MKEANEMAETQQTEQAPTIEQIREKLREVVDPEIMLNIIDLGLVYDIQYDNGDVLITMTLTSPGCPLGPIIRGEAYAKLKELPGVKDVDVQIVWDPPWDPRTMASDDVKMMLGIW